MLYAILDYKARSWWYHKELRAKGNTQEARMKERQSIKSSLKALRETQTNNGWLSIGRGGWTLNISPGHRMEHYGGLNEPIPLACLLLGIPIIDSTTIPDDQIIKTVNFPMAHHTAQHKDSYGPFDYAPLIDVAPMYAALGATLYHL